MSKQFVSGMVIHGLNLGLAYILSKGAKADQCVWYFINLVIDTTLGTLLCWIMLKLLDRYAKIKNYKNLTF